MRTPRLLRRSTALVAAACLVLVACGDDGGSDPAPAAGDSADGTGDGGSDEGTDPAGSGDARLLLQVVGGETFSSGGELLCSYFPTSAEPIMVANFFSDDQNEFDGAVLQVFTTVGFVPGERTEGQAAGSLLISPDPEALVNDRFDALSFTTEGTPDAVSVSVEGQSPAGVVVAVSGTCAPTIVEE